MKELSKEEWKIEGDLVIKEGKIYVLKDMELRAEIIWLHHDVLVAGSWRTMEDCRVGDKELLVARSNKRL